MENWVKTITQEHIGQLGISPTDCIGWVRDAFLMKDRAQMPAKMGVCPREGDFITSMPCLLPEHDGKRIFGIKIVSRIEGQVPMLKSDIYLYDATTGRLMAVVDGDWITSMRTGAVAALAIDLLQRDGTDTYSLMGLGNIARAVALCLIDNNRGRHIRVRLMHYKDQAESFIERFKDYDNVDFEIVDDGRAFVAEADVLISCVTFARDLLFPDDSLFKPGVTVVPVHTRGFQNCDLFFDKVFGDDTSQISSFRYFDRFRQYNELGQVLQGKADGRTGSQERILSYNYGMGLHDVFFASRIYEQVNGGGAGFNYKKHDRKVWV